MNNHNQDSMQDKRQNMANLRQSIKSICTKKNQSGETVWKTSPGPEEKPANRRRRKTSENFKSFQSLSILKDQSISQTFSQFFELQQKLGEGTQSVVYQCRELGTSNIYAVKIVKQRDLELMYNLRQCYQIIQQLDHQSIIKGKYLFMNQKKITCHMVIEYISFPDLRSFLKQKQEKGEAIDENTVSDILESLLDCLSYMQSKGVCHRDIKPENILYDPVTGKLKLIDFDIARMQRYSHEKLELWSCTGTPSYRAPQTYSKGYGIPVDIWAVGMITFELLTGRLPFKTRSLASNIKKICHQNIVFDDYDLSSSAKSLLNRLLDKNPETRISPKDALAHPFILKNQKIPQSNKFLCSMTKPLKKRRSCKEQAQTEICTTPTKYYEEEMQFNLFSTLSKDMGIRFCQE